MSNKINKSHLIVTVTVLCLIISGCLGGGIVQKELADGSQYVGEFKDDLFHGQGTYYYTNGDQYVGEWKDNKRHGQGTLTYAYGEYVGEWKGGQFHGQGILTWPDGSKYVGEFKDGKHHGQGTFTYADGFQEEGRWQDGNFLG